MSAEERSCPTITYTLLEDDAVHSGTDQQMTDTSPPEHTSPPNDPSLSEGFSPWGDRTEITTENLTRRSRSGRGGIDRRSSPSKGPVKKGGIRVRRGGERERSESRLFTPEEVEQMMAFAEANASGGSRATKSTNNVPLSTAAQQTDSVGGSNNASSKAPPSAMTAEDDLEKMDLD